MKTNFVIIVLLLFSLFLSGLFIQSLMTLIRINASQNTLTLKVKIQGEYNDGATKQVTVSVYDNEKQIKEFPDVEFRLTSKPNVFTGTIGFQSPDPNNTYSIVFKPVHGFAKVFCDTQTSSGNCFSSKLKLTPDSTLYFTDDTIMLGDTTPEDNALDALDLSRIKAQLNNRDEATDINGDGITNTVDFSLALFSLGKGVSDDHITWLHSITPTVTPTPTAVPSSAPTETPTPTPAPVPDTQSSAGESPQTGNKFDKNVAIYIFNPTLTSQGGQTLIAYKHWNDPMTLADQTIRWFSDVTRGRLSYHIVYHKELDTYLQKGDGFTYDESSYLACLNDQTKCHNPDIINYQRMLSDYGICDAFNQGQFDEVWLFGAPWFGFYESTLAGPNAFNYNSPPVTNTACNKLLPIMGFSYERDMSEMIHDFGHRTESTMMRVFGDSLYDWHSKVNNDWDRFAMITAYQPQFGYSGCGDIHYPPNASQSIAYDYSNTGSVPSICDEFYRYPAISESENAQKPVSCSSWGCSDVGNYRYWFSHLPSARGNTTGDRLNDWWYYMVNPNDLSGL